MSQNFFDTAMSMAGCAAFALGPVAGPLTATVLMGGGSLFDALGQKDGPTGFPEIEAMEACFEELKQRQFYDKINDSLAVFNAKYKWYRSAYVSAWGQGTGKAGWPDIKEAFETSLNMALSANDNFLEKIEALKLGDDEFQRLALPAFYYGVTLFVLFNQTYYLVKTAEHGKQPYFQGLNRSITDLPDYIKHSETMLSSIGQAIAERNNKVGDVVEKEWKARDWAYNAIFQYRRCSFYDSGSQPPYSYDTGDVRCDGKYEEAEFRKKKADTYSARSNYKSTVDKKIHDHYFVPSLVVDPATGARSQGFGDAQTAYAAMHSKLKSILADAQTTYAALRQAYGQPISPTPPVTSGALPQPRRRSRRPPPFFVDPG